MFPAVLSKTNNNIPICKNIKRIDNWCWLGLGMERGYTQKEGEKSLQSWFL
jgi:hypothetical protein